MVKKRGLQQSFVKLETLVDGFLLELKYFFLATIISLFHVIPVSALELNIKNYNGSSVLAAEGEVVTGDEKVTCGHR